MKLPDVWDENYYWKLKDEVRNVCEENLLMTHDELMHRIMQVETTGTVNPKMVNDILYLLDR